MKSVYKYSKFIPYLYFISVITYWFTIVNRAEGLTAYPILLFGIPFLWQIIKPNNQLNFVLGTVFVCLSSYLILVYLLDVSNIASISTLHNYLLFSRLFILLNFVMAIWIIRNSLKRSF